MDFDTTLIERLKKVKNLAVLTGAGISAESGVPTFRGKDGLWKQYRAEELATPYAFDSNPSLVWEWYDWRRTLIKPLEPNAAHFTLAKMESHYDNFCLITQNVDGLHQKAGNNNIIELHGNIWKMQCTAEKHVIDNFEAPLKEIPPKCQCSALLRPYIVWFGEALHPNIFENAIQAIDNCELLFVIGTSAIVQPAASLPIIAKESNTFVIEVNIEETPLTPIVDVSLQGKAAEILPALFSWLQDNCI